MTLPRTAGVGSAQADRPRLSRTKAARERRVVVGDVVSWAGCMHCPPRCSYASCSSWPIILVFRMSASHWPLLTGNQGWNFPTNYQKVFQNRFFVSSILFTLKYTVLATVLLLGLGLGPGVAGPGEHPVEGPAPHRLFSSRAALGLASASLLFYGLYSPPSSPLNRLDLPCVGD